MVTIRAATGDDGPFLVEMWHCAAFWDPAAFVLAIDEALTIPELAHYIVGWGRTGDVALIAEPDGGGPPIGAAWYRTFTADEPGYGYVADDVPEFAVAVVADARRQGVASALLDALLDAARGAGLSGLSLSVSHGNRSRRIYERAGFVQVGDDGDSAVMLRTFDPEA